MANNSSNRPVRRRRIDVNLRSIDAVNEAAAASTAYFIPQERRPKRKHPPAYSQDSDNWLDYEDSDRTEYGSTGEDDLPFDPQSTFDMVAETQNTINQGFEEAMVTIGDEWERADGRLRSRILAALLVALRVSTENRLMPSS
ncbi:hypothetical protein SLS55_008882 [Diplodia seriata]|uniref:Uncharacterized protein n=1 Tax=Diplodia seriata TaxID=420778 RepID=A0ABR3C775_9PEZI